MSGSPWTYISIGCSFVAMVSTNEGPTILLCTAAACCSFVAALTMTADNHNHDHDH